jgi:hypothetical protein
MAEVTLAEAARILDISKQLLSYHRVEGNITTRQVGSIYLVDLDVLK